MDFGESLKAEIARARQAIVEAKARCQVLEETLEIYLRSGPNRTSRQSRAVLSTGAEKNSQAKKTKADHIRELVLDGHVGGVSGRDIVSAMKAKRVRISANGVFAALSKLKKRGLAEVRDGRYFPSQALLKTNRLVRSTGGGVRKNK